MESDEDLIVAHVAGDENAFPRLVGRHLKTVYSFAFHFVGNSSDAEDISQESFLKVWKNLKRYSSEHARFKTWLMRIVRNTAIDYLRKRKDIPLSSFEDDDGKNVLADIPDETPLPEELLIKKYEANEIELAARELPPLYREVLLLYYGDDRTLQETADILNISANTVKSRHRRALAALRKILVHLRR